MLFAGVQPAAAMGDELSADRDKDGIPDIHDLDDDNDGIPDSIECSGFVGEQQISVVNSSFEMPNIDESADKVVRRWGRGPWAVTFLHADVDGWMTTAGDAQIEIWDTTFNGVQSYLGEQHAEINANKSAALYQDIMTTPGETMRWSFAHRGRTGVDTIELRIGTLDGTVNYTEQFQTDKDSWAVYSGTYTVPAGQTDTRFEYRAVATANGNKTTGNFLDDIRFYQISSCAVDTDGDGVVDSFDRDSDNDGISDLVESGLPVDLIKALDTNDDGIIDAEVGDNGLANAIETDDSQIATFDADGDNVPDSPANRDGDNHPDFQDVDSDDNGINDITERGYGYLDADKDGRIDDDMDTDGDGIADVIDNNNADCGGLGVDGPLTWVNNDAVMVAFEDLRNVGYVDWDYNDFVVNIDIDYATNNAGNIVIMHIAYDAIARGASLSHKFIHDVPVFGGGQALLNIADGEGVGYESAVSTFSDDTNFEIFEDTLFVLPAAENVNFANTEPGQADYLEGHTATMSLYLDAPADNAEVALSQLPFDPYIYVYGTGQEVHMPIPGHSDNMQIVNSLLDPTAPLSGYSMPLARVIDNDWNWPAESIGMWRSHPQYVDFITSGETTHTDWYDVANADSTWIWREATPIRAAMGEYEAVESRYFGRPATADLDNDGSVEIIMANLAGQQLEVFDADGYAVWTRPVDSGIKAGVTVADITGDSVAEILFGTEDGKLHAYDSNGNVVAGFPVQVSEYGILASVAVNAADSSIAVSAADGRLYVRNSDGSARWDATLGDAADKFGSQFFNSAPVVADIDGNGSAEIITGGYNGTLYVYNMAGQLVWSFATGDAIMSTATVANIDGVDGAEIIFGSNDSFVYTLNANGELVWKQRTGWMVRSSATVADMDQDGDLELLIGSDDNNVWAMHHDGSLVAGWPFATSGEVVAQPTVADVDGDGQNEVVIGSADANVYAIELDGVVAAGFPQPASVSIFGSAAVVNLDDDAENEIIVGDFGGKLLRIGAELNAAPSAVTLSSNQAVNATSSATALIAAAFALMLGTTAIVINRN